MNYSVAAAQSLPHLERINDTYQISSACPKTSASHFWCYLFVLGKVFFSSGWSQNCYVVKDVLELLNLHPPLPGNWDYKFTPTCLVDLCGSGDWTQSFSHVKPAFYQLYVSRAHPRFEAPSYECDPLGVSKGSDCIIFYQQFFPFLWNKVTTTMEITGQERTRLCLPEDKWHFPHSRGKQAGLRNHNQVWLGGKKATLEQVFIGNDTFVWFLAEIFPQDSLHVLFLPCSLARGGRRCVRMLQPIQRAASQGHSQLICSRQVVD